MSVNERGDEESPVPPAGVEWCAKWVSEFGYCAEIRAKFRYLALAHRRRTRETVGHTKQSSDYSFVVRRS